MECPLERFSRSSLVGWVPQVGAIAIIQVNNIWVNPDLPLQVVLELRAWTDFNLIRSIELSDRVEAPSCLTITPS